MTTSKPLHCIETTRLARKQTRPGEATYLTTVPRSGSLGV